MHDPMCVAFDVKLPIPRRVRWRERADRPRWSIRRHRRTNDANLGEPTYPWWRPKGYDVTLAGRALGWRDFVTVWHVEPRGADSGEVCKHWIDRKHSNRWRWHVHHWHVQVIPWQRFRKRFVRCGECSRRLAGDCGHGYMGGSEVYHRECMGLRHLRRQQESDVRLIRHLFATVRVELDLSTPELLSRITDPKRRTTMPFHDAYRLTRLLGYERDDKYRLVPSATGRFVT